MKKGIFLIIFLSVFSNTSFAQEFDKAVVSFLKSDYQKTISTCEYIFSLNPDKREDAQICYLLAVSYLKNDNYLAAFDMFSLINDEFYNIKLKEKSLIGLIDVSFMQKDYQGSINLCEEFLHTYKRSDYLPLVYYRLAECMFRINDVALFNIYKQIILINYKDSVSAYKLSKVD
ncbi:MAG: outer membrane protein assembly factor BamD [Candidatus Gygaella obscura]|nr:outer membrane protein assembly factor BamD [Candidatus Gygaella obscura]